MLSSRQIEDVDHILGGAVDCVAGVHGLERRCARGEVRLAPGGGGLAHVIDPIDALAAATPGVIAEWKRSAVALHYRDAPRAGEALFEFADRHACAHGLVVQPGAMVVELREPGPDKGAALNAFMAEPPFFGASPIFVGADTTAEAPFAAAQALGGFALAVGDQGPLAADRRLADIDAVEGWLAEADARGAFPLSALPRAA